MTNILQINTSLFSAGGQSTALASQLVSALRRRHPRAQVTVRDLAGDPVPHLDGARFTAFVTEPEERDPAQQSVVDFSDALIDELRRADVVVIGLPMYNFGVPSQLKAYFDHIARAGVTFRYTDQGPVGLLADKKVYLLAARGGVYAGTERDSQSSYVQTFLAFIGLKDVEFIYAEGLSMGEATKDAAVREAHRAIERVASMRAAA